MPFLHTTFNNKLPHEILYIYIWWHGKLSMGCRSGGVGPSYYLMWIIFSVTRMYVHINWYRSSTDSLLLLFYYRNYVINDYWRLYNSHAQYGVHQGCSIINDKLVGCDPNSCPVGKVADFVAVFYSLHQPKCPVISSPIGQNGRRFGRRLFQMHIHGLKVLSFDSKFTELCS